MGITSIEMERQTFLQPISKEMRSCLYVFVISAINSGPWRASVEPCDYPFRRSKSGMLSKNRQTPFHPRIAFIIFSWNVPEIGIFPWLFLPSVTGFSCLSHGTAGHQLGCPMNQDEPRWSSPVELLTSLWSSPKTSTLSPKRCYFCQGMNVPGLCPKRLDALLMLGREKMAGCHIQNTSNCLCFQRISEYEWYFFMYLMVLLQEVTCFYHILRSVGPVS